MRHALAARLDDCNDELQKIKERIDKNQFDEIVLFLQCYAIIRACGTIEYIVKNMIADHVDKNSNPEVRNFISTNVRESSTNPSTGNISNLLGKFSSEIWRKLFDERLKLYTAEKGSLNSLVQLRNDFSHGSRPNTTINTIIKYFKDSCVIVSLIDEVITGS